MGAEKEGRAGEGTERDQRGGVQGKTGQEWRGLESALEVTLCAEAETSLCPLKPFPFHSQPDMNKSLPLPLSQTQAGLAHCNSAAPQLRAAAPSPLPSQALISSAPTQGGDRTSHGDLEGKETCTCTETGRGEKETLQMSPHFQIRPPAPVFPLERGPGVPDLPSPAGPCWIGI